MRHNGAVVPAEVRSAGAAAVLVLAGLATYVQAFPGALQVVADAGLPAALVGAFLVSAGTYHLLAELALQGRHRRPNAEVALVVSLFGFLVLLHVALTPRLAEAMGATQVMAWGVALVGVLVASAAYLAHPTWLRS